MAASTGWGRAGWSRDGWAPGEVRRVFGSSFVLRVWALASGGWGWEVWRGEVGNVRLCRHREPSKRQREAKRAAECAATQWLANVRQRDLMGTELDSVLEEHEHPGDIDPQRLSGRIAR